MISVDELLKQNLSLFELILLLIMLLYNRATAGIYYVERTPFFFFSFIFPSILSRLRYNGIIKYAMLLCIVGAVKGHAFFLKMKEWHFSHSMLQWLGLFVYTNGFDHTSNSARDSL